ncbi:hypothetical protein ACIQBJ_33890 [Kitasatospora sp. NPDC088391]|uniref:hypothetical protein n=1 Tax=Kitasatospora sp. NPDC088391 TaxID=3364074 RepID=UPI003818738B
MSLFDAPAVPESDDWEAWLAHADLLTREGDLRGEAIRQEHHREHGDADPSRLTAAYAEVERQLGLDGLREDGSWQFTWSRGFIDEACFRLAEDTRPHRRSLVERLLTDRPRTTTIDPADPEQWESALIDALLAHPATHRLRTLELHLTDYHHSGEHSAISLAGRRRPRLERMYYGYGFTYLCEPGETSAGKVLDPEDHMGTGVVSAEAGEALWRSLPALRTLELDGGFLFNDVEHETLTRLRIRGYPFTRSMFPSGTPNLVSLEVDVRENVHGVHLLNDVLDELTPQRFPKLRNLDLGNADFDPEEGTDFLVLADSSLLPQLEHLRIKNLVIEEEYCEGEPLDALRELAPRFAHLGSFLADEIYIEDTAANDGTYLRTGAEEVTRLLPRFDLSRRPTADAVDAVATH